MRTYDPSAVDVTFNGILIQGFVVDEFIAATRDEDGWGFQPNVSGGGARNRNPVRSGTVTLTLTQAAPHNALLQAIALADELNGSGVGEIFIKDRSTAAGQLSAQNAWIQKQPDFTRAVELGQVVWVIKCEVLNFFHDGVIDA
jgi:hypothetical protein